METNMTSLSELLLLTLFLGSITYILGILFQILIVLLNKSRPKRVYRIMVLQLLTRFSTIFSSILIWHLWFLKIDIMIGPLLLPALLSEIISSPLFLKIFGYKLIQLPR